MGEIPVTGGGGLIKGAFYKISNNGQPVVNDGGEKDALAGFQASRSNGTYGKSSTVQPSSYRVLYLIKF